MVIAEARFYGMIDNHREKYNIAVKKLAEAKKDAPNRKKLVADKNKHYRKVNELENLFNKDVKPLFKKYHDADNLYLNKVAREKQLNQTLITTKNKIVTINNKTKAKNANLKELKKAFDTLIYQKKVIEKDLVDTKGWVTYAKKNIKDYENKIKSYEKKFK